VHGLEKFDWISFAAGARTIFDWEDVTVAGSPQDWTGQFLSRMREAGHKEPTMGVYAGPGRVALLRLRPDIDLDVVLARIPPTLRRLDVVLLHHLVLEPLLGVGEQAVREERNLSYFRDAALAYAEVEKGRGQIAFLLNSTPVGAVYANALADCPMPQKSTDFYPKLLSGLTIYWLDNPAGR
jgi:uncharacterized protein (DUF1015 family)